MSKTCIGQFSHLLLSFFIKTLFALFVGNINLRGWRCFNDIVVMLVPFCTHTDLACLEGQRSYIILSGGCNREDCALQMLHFR